MIINICRRVYFALYSPSSKTTLYLYFLLFSFVWAIIVSHWSLYLEHAKVKFDVIDVLKKNDYLQSWTDRRLHRKQPRTKSPWSTYFRRSKRHYGQCSYGSTNGHNLHHKFLGRTQSRRARYHGPACFRPAHRGRNWKLRGRWWWRFFGNSNDMHPIYWEIQSMIDSALKKYEESRLSRLIDEVIKERFTALLEDANHLATKGIHIPSYSTVEKTVSQALHQEAADEIINKNRDRLDESKGFVHSFIRRLMKTPNFTVPTTKLGEQHTDMDIFQNARLYNQSMGH